MTRSVPYAILFHMEGVMNRNEYESFKYVSPLKSYTPRRKGYVRTVLYATIFVCLIIFV